MNGAPTHQRGGATLAGRVLVLGLVVAGIAALLAASSRDAVTQQARVDRARARPGAELACARVVANRANIPAPRINAEEQEYFDQIAGYMRHCDNLLPVLRELDGAADDRAFRRFVSYIEGLRRTGGVYVQAFEYGELEGQKRLGAESYDLLRSLQSNAEANHVSLCID